jgi:hypothetical protein
VGGTVDATAVRADATLMMIKKQATVAASGSVILHYQPEVIEPLSIRSKGDITLFLPKNPSANLDASFGGWDIVLTMQGQTENYGGGSYQGKLGEGGAEIKLSASGDIVVSDEHFIIPQTEDLDVDDAGNQESGFNFNFDFNPFGDDADGMDVYGRRVQKAMSKVEQKLRKMEGRMQDASRRIAERQEEIARRIEERAMNRAMHAERLAEMKVQKRAHIEAIEALEQVKEELRNLDLGIELPALDFLKDIEIPPVPPVTPVTPVRPERAPKAPAARDVPHEERMLILEMLKDGSLTVDEAEKLLAALKG